MMLLAMMNMEIPMFIQELSREMDTMLKVISSWINLNGIFKADYKVFVFLYYLMNHKELYKPNPIIMIVSSGLSLFAGQTKS